MRVQSVGGELRSHMPHDVAKKKFFAELDKELLVQHSANAKDVEGGESSAERSSGVTGTQGARREWQQMKSELCF